eukprot:767654-Hanusia_phi.AAC.2
MEEGEAGWRREKQDIGGRSRMEEGGAGGGKEEEEEETRREEQAGAAAQLGGAGRAKADLEWGDCSVEHGDSEESSCEDLELICDLKGGGKDRTGQETGQDRTAERRAE